MQKAKLKTREQIADGHFRQIKVMPQNKRKLASGEITENELWEAAYAFADKKLLKQQSLLEAGYNAQVDWVKEDQKFKDQREAQYRRDYDWTIKSDQKILENILTTEVNLRRLERELQKMELSVTEREKLSRVLASLLSTHKELLIAAGIDRISRERRKAVSDPMSDWNRIKELASNKMAELASEFIPKMESVSSEAELRDRMKYHLGYSFEVIDAALQAHRRVLGYDLNVEKS